MRQQRSCHFQRGHGITRYRSYAASTSAKLRSVIELYFVSTVTLLRRVRVGTDIGPLGAIFCDHAVRELLEFVDFEVGDVFNFRLCRFCSDWYKSMCPGGGGIPRDDMR